MFRPVTGGGLGQCRSRRVRPKMDLCLSHFVHFKRLCILLFYEENLKKKGFLIIVISLFVVA